MTSAIDPTAGGTLLPGQRAGKEEVSGQLQVVKNEIEVLQSGVETLQGLTDAGAAAVTSDPDITGITSATTVELALTSLRTGLAGLETAIDEGGLDAITSAHSFPYPSPVSDVVTLSTADLASMASGSVVSDRVVGLLNDTPSTALTCNLPVDVLAGDAFLLYHDDTQTGAITIQNVGGVGSVNGSASLVSNSPGAFILLICKSNPGSAPVWRTGQISELVQVLIRGYTEAVVEITAADTSALTYTYTSQDANIAEYILEADPASFTIAGVPVTEAFALMVKVTMDGTGGFTWPHPTGCLFAGGDPPTIDDAANAETWLTYLVTPWGTYCFDGGAGWAV